MAIIRAWGCDDNVDRYIQGSNATNKWSLQSTAGPWSNYCWYDAGGYSGPDSWIDIAPYGNGVVEGGITFYYRSSYNADANWQGIRLQDQTTVLFDWKVYKHNGTMDIDTPNETALTGIFGWSNSTWYRVDLAFKVNDVDGYYKAYIDGALVGEFTGSDTDPASLNGEVNRILFYMAGGYSNAYIDDIVVWDVSAGNWTGVQSTKHRIYPLSPSSDGAESDWVPTAAGSNYDKVDDPNADDGDTTKVSASLAGSRDLYGMQTLSEADLSIYAVQARAMTLTSIAGEFKIGARVNSTESLSNAILAPLAYGPSSYVMESNPADSQNWENADVDAAEFVLEKV